MDSLLHSFEVVVSFLLQRNGFLHSAFLLKSHMFGKLLVVLDKELKTQFILHYHTTYIHFAVFFSHNLHISHLCHATPSLSVLYTDFTHHFVCVLLSLLTVYIHTMLVFSHSCNKTNVSSAWCTCVAASVLRLILFFLSFIASNILLPCIIIFTVSSVNASISPVTELAYVKALSQAFHCVSECHSLSAFPSPFPYLH